MAASIATSGSEQVCTPAEADAGVEMMTVNPLRVIIGVSEVRKIQNLALQVDSLYYVVNIRRISRGRSLVADYEVLVRMQFSTQAICNVFFTATQ
jgi:hypothetical protein